MSKTVELKQYAALDAYLHMRLFSALTKLIRGEDVPVTKYTSGVRVQVLYRKRVIAIGTLEFVGATGGEVRKWGKTTVEKKPASCGWRR